MPTVINTNLASLYAQNNLSNAQNNLAQSVMRLSSGLRINSAKDDASGLAVSQNMQSQINGINQSVRNLNDATGLVQVADTAVATIQDMLLRMKQLATQGYNGSISVIQKQNLLDEIKALNTQINNTATTTKYNGNQLINSSSTPTLDNSGLNAGEATQTANVVFTNIDVNGAANLAKTYSFTNAGATVTLNGGAGYSQSVTIANTLNAGSSLTLNFDNLGIKFTIINNTAGNIAAATLGNAFTSGNIVTAAGPASTLDFMAGSDSGISNLVVFNRINIRTDASGDATAGHDAMKNLGTSITNLQTAINTPNNDVAIATGFQDLGSKVDSAINQTSNDRSVFGALLNQISYISQNLSTQSTNLQNSKSTILDTDFAAETARLTKGQIMQQAATAMLAQANQMPNVVLSLLK